MSIVKITRVTLEEDEISEGRKSKKRINESEQHILKNKKKNKMLDL